MEERYNKEGEEIDDQPDAHKPDPSTDFANVLARILQLEIPMGVNETNSEHAVNMIHLFHRFSDIIDLEDYEVSLLELPELRAVRESQIRQLPGKQNRFAYKTDFRALKQF